MRKRKIRKALRKYAEQVLNERGIPYSFMPCDDEFLYLCTGLTSEKFHRLVERAMCLDEQENVHHGRLTISYWEYTRGLYNTAFHILRKDYAKFISAAM